MCLSLPIFINIPIYAIYHWTSGLSFSRAFFDEMAVEILETGTHGRKSSLCAQSDRCFNLKSFGQDQDQDQRREVWVNSIDLDRQRTTLALSGFLCDSGELEHFVSTAVACFGERVNFLVDASL
jgi:hypothetical protein